jgi:hypothetical protein
MEEEKVSPPKPTATLTFVADLLDNVSKAILG